MLSKNAPKEEIKGLEEKLAKYQKQYEDLKKQSPDRWWHDEFFEIQLRVLEAMIEETKKRIIELEKKR
jgi:hypothetical protein